MNCPECQSEDVVWGTDKELEKLCLIEWDCSCCGATWETGKGILKEIQGKTLEDVR